VKISASELCNPSKIRSTSKRWVPIYNLEEIQDKLEKVLRDYLTTIELSESEEKMQVFVQIASYRDEELSKTIDSCIKNAKRPENLSFGIVHQYDESTLHLLDRFRGKPEFRIAEYHWTESRGVGVARNMCGEFYRGEAFTLQTDSHMRFGKDWDEQLITQWRSLNDERAILSCHPLAFSYADDNSETLHHVQRAIKPILRDEFYNTDIPVLISNTLEIREPPYKGCFFCGGLAFHRGDVLINAPYIKDISFIGEEIVRSVQLFTHGYNFYLPNEPRLYHLYKREDLRHWQDLDAETVNAMHEKSYSTVRNILKRRDTRNLGDVRTIKQFEQFAGVDFNRCLVSPNQKKLAEPPFENDSSWLDRL
jgi:hypothetical protein